MRIIIAGPRSVGKSKISRILAKKLKVKYIESDKIINEHLKRYGGLDKVIKSGLMDKHIGKSPGLIKIVLKNKEYVLALAGSSISSTSQNNIQE